jgi:hypothetical protein
MTRTIGHTLRTLALADGLELLAADLVRDRFVAFPCATSEVDMMVSELDPESLEKVEVQWMYLGRR